MMYVYCIVWRYNVITKEIKICIKPCTFPFRVWKYTMMAHVARTCLTRKVVVQTWKKKRTARRSYFLISGPGEIKCFMKSHKLSLRMCVRVGRGVASLTSICGAKKTWCKYLTPVNITTQFSMYILFFHWSVSSCRLLTLRHYFIRITRIKYV